MAEEVTFSVSVNLQKLGSKDTIAKNVIRKLKTSYTWFDVFDIVTEQIETIPKACIENFEKLSSISVSPRSQAAPLEVYHPDGYDQLSVLTDFDKALKYVTIDVKVPQDNDQCCLEKDSGHSAATPNAFDLLMKSRSQSHRLPAKISTEKERFTGLFVYLTIIIYQTVIQG